MDIRLTGVDKRFGDFVAVDGADVEVRSGELLALLGPSGSGKTTLLRVIAGLEAPDAGTVEIGGAEASGVGVPERGIGFVFQHYALFKHMTVQDNIGFALRMQKRPNAEVRERVAELLALFSLQGLASRFPDQLSGGQRQRVALARALAAQPRILLLDEPFGALDARVRQELRRWLRRLHDEIGVTTVFVTHDQEEALEVADRVVIMNRGRVEQTGTPEEVFTHPANEFVMHFLGNVNVFRGRVEGGKAYVGEMVLGAPAHDAAEPTPARVYFRPHDLVIERTSAGDRSFQARVVHVFPLGGRVKVELVTPAGETAIAEVPRERYEELQLRRDMEVFVSPTDSTIFVQDYSI